MKTVGELRQHADAALFSESYQEALRLYASLVQQQPDNLDARLRVADTLMALGEVQRAAVVYTQLAKHAARGGYPLRALTALKVLSALEPALETMIEELATLYAKDSGRLGRGVRKAPPDPEQALPFDFSPLPDSAQLVEQAAAAAADYTGAGLVYPDKLIPIPLLSLLGANEFAAVLQAVQLVRVRRDAALLREGQPGHSFYVLVRGSVVVTRAGDPGEEIQLATLHDGAIFGEMALLTQSPRTATVTATTDCDLLCFDREALAEASATVRSLKGAMGSFAQERLLNNVMATAGIFRPLDRAQRHALMQRFVAVQAAPGAALIREGEPGTGLHVILRGQVQVTKEDEGQPRELARLGPGEMFGEISLLNDEPTTATVSATEQSTVLFLGKTYFDRLVEAVPEVREYLEQVGEERQMDTRISLADDEGLDSPDPLDEDLEVEVEVLI